MNSTDQIISITQGLFLKEKIESHPLMLAISQNKLSQKQIKVAGLQIYHVVKHFPRFIAALLSNIPDYKLRMPLVENLFEEHGRLNTEYVHCQTYKEFLKGIGLSDNEIDMSKPIICVTAYNRAMLDLCLHYPYEEGLSALGIVEEIVARVSPIIGAFAQMEYDSKDKSLFHFTSHETLDIAHAREIYELVSLCYKEENKERINQGMLLGMYFHKQMYSGIWMHLQELE